MNIEMKTKHIFRSLLLGAAACSALTACDDYMDGEFTVAAKQQLDEYIEAQPDLSLFLDIIDQGDLRGMVHAYGTYTLFVPTNDAVMDRLGAASENEARAIIAQLPAEEARAMVKYHMLSDTLHTYDFVDTRMTTANMEADYLLTKYVSGETENYYVVNRKARIIEPDVSTGNGILHVVNGFLHRPDFSVQQVLADINSYRDTPTEDDENKYDLLTGLIDRIVGDTLGMTLNELLGFGGDDTRAGASEVPFTFLAQSNASMIEAEITDVDALIEHLQKNNIGGYSQHDLLKNWVQYHFLQGRYYLTDLMGGSSANTFTDQNKVIVLSTLGEQIFMNRFEAFDDPGIEVLRSGDFVDYPCSNGIIQTVGSDDGNLVLEIIERAASRIDWDMCDQPEIRALKNYRKAGASVTFTSTLTADENGYVPTDLSMMSWSGKNSPTVSYYCAWEPKAGLDQSGSKFEEYVYGDYLNFRIGTTVVQYMEIKTPTLVKGKYKVWLRYRTMGTSTRGDGTVRTTFKQDGQEDQVFGTAQLSYYAEKSYSLEDDEANSAKGYYCPLPLQPAQNFISCCLLGTIDVINDGVHTLRLDPQDANQSLGQNYDMLMFIPVDQDQVNPRVCCDGSYARVYKVVDFAEDGTPIYDRSVYRDMVGFNTDYRSHIFPFSCDVQAGNLGVGECPYAWCPNHDPSLFAEE